MKNAKYKSGEVKSPAEIVKEIKKKCGGKSPLREIWGKWPGDESIDEILAALRKNVGEERKNEG